MLSTVQRKAWLISAASIHSDCTALCFRNRVCERFETAGAGPIMNSVSSVLETTYLPLLTYLLIWNQISKPESVDCIVIYFMIPKIVQM